MIHLLVFYFMMGASALSAVYDTLFSRENITLSAEQLISLGIWTGLPWSIKILFGSTLDRIPLPRKAFLLLGQTIMLLCALAWVDFASTRYFLLLWGEYRALLAIGFLGSVGTVIARLAVDTMAIELPEEKRAKMQVWMRVALVSGGLTGALLSGPLANHLSMPVVFALAAICPAISLLVSLFSGSMPRTSREDSSTLLLISLGYAALISVLALGLESDSAQNYIFGFSLVSVSAVLARVLGKSELSSQKVRYLVVGLVAIFLFRTTPGAGPSLTWYYLGELKFDKTFLGTLRVVETVSSLAILLSMQRLMARGNLRTILIILTSLVTLLSIPDLLIVYKLTFGINPQHLVLVDSAAISAISQLAMVPLGILVSRTAPGNGKATFLALTASLMNLAMVAGDLCTRELNKVFLVTRTDFTQLPHLLLASFTIGLVLSILGCIVLIWQPGAPDDRQE